jgi:ribonuclease HI
MQSANLNSPDRAALHSPVTALIVAYIDGGARGNPGPAGYGVRIEGPDGTLVDEFCASIGIATNNVAEYRGLIAALEWAKGHGHRRVHVRSDSQLLVRQMLGVYKVKHPGLQALHAEARQLAHAIGRVTFEHVARERNADADRLANLAMDGRVIVSRHPSAAGPEAAAPGRRPSQSDSEPPRQHSESVIEAADASPGDPFTPMERAVRLFVYRHFVETTRAPDIGTIAAAVQSDQRAVLSALRKLVAAHALVMAPASTCIWMAHPFSAVPTAYPVDARGRTYWANCAWDAAGVMSLLGGGVTRTRCADCGVELTIAVRDGRMTGDGVVHYAVPPRKFWDNVAYT